MRKETALICKNCEKDFFANRSDAVFCSNACRQNNYKKSLSGRYFRHVNKRDDKYKANIHLLIWVNELFYFVAKETILRSDIDTLLSKINFQNELFADLPEHSRIRNKIKTFCDAFSKFMRDDKYRVLDANFVRRKFFNELENLKAGTRTVSTLVVNL